MKTVCTPIFTALETVASGIKTCAFADFVKKLFYQTIIHFCALRYENYQHFKSSIKTRNLNFPRTLRTIEIAYNILKFAVGSDIQFKIFLLVFSFFSLLFRLPVIFQFVSVCTTISAAGKSVTSARKSCPSADFVKRLFIRRCCLINIG